MDYTTEKAKKMNNPEDFQDYLSDVRNLLARHKLVEKLVHRQDMPHHDLVESLVHKQNMVELQRLLNQLGSQPIARILEALGADYIDESEVLTPADDVYHLDKIKFKVLIRLTINDLG